MKCTRRFLNFGWEHHSWHPRVTSAASVETQETNMWGRVVHGHSVLCQKEEVCQTCGKTRRAVSCICDTARGDECAIRLAWLEESRRQT